MVKSCRFLSTGEESPSLLAAAMIALTLTATATDVSAQWRRRGWGWGPGVAAGVIGGAVIAGAMATRSCGQRLSHCPREVIARGPNDDHGRMWPSNSAWLFQ